MIKMLNQTGKPYCFVMSGDRNFIFLLFPYLPYGDFGGAVVDGYYPTSNEGYHAAKTLSKGLTELGVRSVFPPNFNSLGVPNYKQTLAGCSKDFFVGKNTLLYHRDFGSRFCIEAIELAEVPGELKGEFCPRAKPGSCDRCGACAKACPTGAIGSDGTFDREKCLRQIMTHDRFSDEIAEKIGRRLYGCDICQRVCPHNAGIGEGKNPFAGFLSFQYLLGSRASKKAIEPLLPLLGSNYLRPRRILNLAAVGAGNSGDSSLVELLRPLAESSDEAIAENAARSIKKLLSL